VFRLQQIVATSTAASIITKDKDFVSELWNSKPEPYPDGYFDSYYDGLLYLFSLMHLSGNYRVITPQNH